MNTSDMIVKPSWKGGKMKFIRKTVITRSGDNEQIPYLIRWSILTTPWFSIKLHKILISDDDCPHSHPWSFVSVILKGGYVEESWADGDCTKPGLKRLFGAGSILWRPIPYVHRLEVYQPALTLVLTFKREVEWGFWTKEGWVAWFNYTSKERC